MTDVPIIARNILARHFGDDQRMISAFEDMNAGAAETQAATTANVDATTALQDATVIVLSANGAFTNERILRLDPGLAIDVDDTYVTVRLNGVAFAENYSVTLVAAGDCELIVPLSGTLAVEERVNTTLGNYLNDAAAAAGGVLVGGRYRNGSVLMVRVA